MKLIFLLTAIFFAAFCQPAVDVKEASPTETRDIVAKGGAQFIDVRTPEEYASGHAPSAVNIPLDTIYDKLPSLKKDEPIYVICQTGKRSKKAAEILANNGFSAVYNVAGGTAGWVKDGLKLQE